MPVRLSNASAARRGGAAGAVAELPAPPLATGPDPDYAAPRTVA